MEHFQYRGAWIRSYKFMDPDQTGSATLQRLPLAVYTTVDFAQIILRQWSPFLKMKDVVCCIYLLFSYQYCMIPIPFFLMFEKLVFYLGLRHKRAKDRKEIEFFFIKGISISDSISPKLIFSYVKNMYILLCV